jgi:polysaccharide export outer membrane protein
MRSDSYIVLNQSTPGMNHIIEPPENKSKPLPRAAMSDAARDGSAGNAARWSSVAYCAAFVGALCLLSVGCQTGHYEESAFQPYQPPAPVQQRMNEVKLPPEGTNAPSAKAIILREGDVVRITFPGAPNLNTSQPVRRDGKINLQLVGEVTAAGMTPAELEAKLVELYAPHLVTKEVRVSVESSVFPVFVTGAVVRPGKVLSDRPITALEAVMEAGGPDSKANLKSVRVIRHLPGEVKNFKINLKLFLDGKPSEPFYLKPSDIVYVPERFIFF